MKKNMENNTAITIAFEEAVSKLVSRREDKKAVSYVLMANGMNPKNFFGKRQSVALWMNSNPDVITFDVWDNDHDETVMVALKSHQACWKDNSTLGGLYTEWEDVPFCGE